MNRHLSAGLQVNRSSRPRQHRRLSLSIALLLLIPILLRSQPVIDAEGDMGVGTLQPDPSALLDLQSTSKGLLLPRLTSAQRDAIADPATGLLVYNTEDSVIQWNFGSFASPEWYTVVGVDSSGSMTVRLPAGAIWYGNQNDRAVPLGIGAPGDVLVVNPTGEAPEWVSANGFAFWALDGNAGTDPTTNYLGTSDDVDLVIGTDGTERGRFSGTSNGGGFGITGPFRPDGDAGVVDEVLVSRGPSAPPEWTSDLNVDDINASGDVAIEGDLAADGNVDLASDAGATVSIGSGTGPVDIQGATTSMATDNVLVGAGPEASVTIGYNDGDGSGPDNPSNTTINGNLSIGSPNGNNGSPTLMQVEGDAEFHSNVSFANLPDLPLTEDALFVGNNANLAVELLSTETTGAVLQQNGTGRPTWSRDLNVRDITAAGDLGVGGTSTLAELVVTDDATFSDDVTFNNGEVAVNGTGFSTGPGTNSTFDGPVRVNNDVTIDGDLANSGDATLASGSGSTATIGNTNGPTTINGGAITIGDPGSNTTLDGTVSFANAPRIPLSDRAILVGGVQGTSGIAEELLSTNIPGSVLQQNSSGMPVWSRNLDIDGIAVVQDLVVTGTSTLGDGNDDIVLDAGSGDITLRGLVNDPSPSGVVTIGPTGIATQTDLTDLGTALSGSIGVARNNTLSGNGTTASPLGVNLANANLWSGTQTFSSIDVDGGSIDNTTVGFTAPRGARFTVLRSGGTTELGDGDDNVTINVGSGEFQIDGLANETAPTAIITSTGTNQVRTTTPAQLGALLGGATPVVSNATLSGSGTTASPLRINLANANSWSANQTFASVDVDGGSIDNTPVGFTTPRGARFTVLRSGSTTELGDGDDDVTINVGSGELQIDGLASDPTPASVLTSNASNQVRETSIADLGVGLGGTVPVASNATLLGDGTTGSPLRLALGNPNSWTGTQTFANLNGTGTIVLGNGGEEVAVDVTGSNLQVSGLDPDASPTSILSITGAGNVRTTSTTDLAGTLSGSITVSSDATLSGTGSSASPLGINLSNANLWSGTQTFQGVDVQSGIINGTTIGTIAPSVGRFTILRSNSTTGLGDGVGSDNVTIDVGTGNFTLENMAPFAGTPGLTTPILLLDGSNNVRRSSVGDLADGLGGNVAVAHDGTLSGNGTTPTPLSLNTGNANSWSATQTFANVNVNGGSINGTAIGGSTPASGSFTSLSTTGTTMLGDGSGNDDLSIDVGSGNLSLTNIASQSSPSTVLTLNGVGQMRQTSVADLAAELADEVAVQTDATLLGDGTAGDPLGLDLANGNTWTVGQTFGDGNAADATTFNTGAGTDLAIGETGVDRSSSVDETFTFDNSGAGNLNVVINGDQTLNGNATVNGEISNTGDATIASGAGSTASIGNTTGATTLEGSDVNIGPVGATTIDIGNVGSTTTIDGSVAFTNLPDLPLATGAIFRGDATGSAEELAAGANGQILTVVGGTPTWTTAPAASVQTNASLLGDGTAGNLLGLNLGNANIWTVGQTFGDGDAADVTTFNTGAGTDLALGETGVDRSSGVDETFTFDNSGAGDLDVIVNGELTTNGNAVINGDQTINGNLSNTGNATLASTAGSTASVGNTTGTTTLEGSDVNIGPVGTATIDIGNAGSTTTINGTVVFDQAPTLPLNQGAIFRGDGSDEAEELAAGAANTVLTSDGTTVSYGLIANDNIAAGAAIAGTKINPDFGAQNVTTTGDVDGDNLNATGDLTVDGATTLGDGNGADATTFNTGSGTDLSIGETGVDRSSGVDETFTFDNSGAGDLDVVINGDQTVNGDATVNGDLSTTGNATLASGAGSTTSIGNTTGATTLEGSDVNIGPVGATTIDIGNAGSTTTIDGSVVFTNLPDLPLATGAIFRGDATGSAEELTAGTNGQILTVIGGTPTWAAPPAGTVQHDATLTGDGTAGSPLGLDLTNANTWTIGQIFGDGDAADATTFNTGAGTDLAIGEGGIDRSSGADETFTFDNSGAGDLDVIVNGDATVNGDLSNTGNATIASGAGSSVTIGNATGTTSLNGDVSFANLPTLPLSDGALLRGNSSDEAEELAAGTNGQILTVVAGTPTWAAAPAGTVQSDATLTGDGTAGNPLGIDLANANTWTVGQTFGDGNAADATTFNTGAGTDLTLGESGVDRSSGADETFTFDNSGAGDLDVQINGDLSNTGNVTLAGGAGSSVTIGNAGGTTTFNGDVSFTNLPDLPLATGAIFRGDGTGIAEELAPGTAGQILTIVGGSPTWAAPPAGTVQHDATLTGDGTAGSPLGLDLTNANIWTVGQTFGDGDAADATTFNTGAGTDLSLGETGVDRSSGVDETFTFDNSGAGDLNVVINGDQTVNGDAAVNGDLSNTGNATLASTAGSTASVGNTTGTTTLEGSDVNIGPVGAATIDIGNAGSTTTINGTVVFDQAPTLPLNQGAIFRGDGSGEAEELAAGAANTVLTSNGTTVSYGLIANDNIAAGAAIVGTKINPDFGAQNVTTTGDIDGDNLNATGDLTVDGATTLGDGNGADATTFNTGSGTDLTLGESGVDRSSGVDETFTFDNSGAGDLDVVINGDQTVNGDLSTTGNATLASGAGSTASIGNTTGTTTLEGSDVNIGPVGAATIDIGNAGSTTTIDGSVVFTNLPDLPLATGAIFRGDATGSAEELAAGANGQILAIVGGTPTWTTAPAASVQTNASLLGDGTAGDPLGLNLGNANIWTVGQTFGDGDAADATTFNTGAGTDLSLGETGVDRSSGVDETFTFDNSGAGDLNVVINGDQTVNGDAAVNGDLSNTGNATLASTAGSTASVGNTTGTTTIEGSDVNIGPVGAATIDIGNAGSTTTINGTVVFDQAPTLPLSQGAIFRGDGSDEAEELAAGANGQILTVVGGTPTWAAPPSTAVQTNATISGDGTAGSPLGVNLSNANSWSGTQAFADIDVNGGAIDNAVIGAGTPADATIEDLSVRNTTLLGDGSGADDITIDVGTGNLTLQNIVTESMPLALLTTNGAGQVRQTDLSDLAAEINDDITVQSNATLQGNGTSGSPLGIDLTNPNAWTAQQSFSDIAVSGGTINGATVGAVSPAFGRFSVLRSTGTTTLGDGDDNVTVNVGTGEFAVQGIATDNAPSTLLTINGSDQVRTTPVSALGSTLSGSIAVARDATLTGDGTTGSPLGINLANANSWSGAQSFGQMSTTGTTILGDGNDNVTVNVGTAELTLQGIDDDPSPTLVLTRNTSNQVRTTTISDLADALADDVDVTHDATLTGDGISSSPLGVNLANPNSWTAQQTYSSVDINGGTLDGVSIGAASRGAGRFTILNANGLTALGDGDDNITLNPGSAELTIIGTAYDAAPTSVLTINGANQVRQTGLSDLADALADDVEVAHDATLSGEGVSTSLLGINLANANAWTGQQTFTSVDINGGSIDGVSIGASTRGAGRFTILNANGLIALGDGDDNVTVNVGSGELAIVGAVADASPTTVLTINGSDQVRETSLSDLAAVINSNVTVQSNATLNGNGSSASPLGVNLANPNSWTAQQTFASADINGGTVDGTVIGGTSRAAASVTTFSAAGNTTLGDGNDNVTINTGTGELAVAGLASLASPATILTINGSSQVRTTSTTNLASTLSGSITVSRNGTLIGTGTTGNPLGLNLASANSWTAQQTFSSVAVNGGTINGTAIGGTTRSSGAFTTLSSTGTTMFGDGNGDNITLNASDVTTGGTVNIDVTNGRLDIDGLVNDPVSTDVLVIDAAGRIGTSTPAALAGGAVWLVTGNGNTDPITNFIGTTNNVGLSIRTNNAERIRVAANGNVGVGTATPSQKVEVQDGNILLSNSGTAGELRLAEPSAGGSQYTAFRAGLQGADITYTLPTTQGAAGSVLANNGSGSLTWVNPNQNGAIGSELFIRKTADESITNVGTLQNDDHLVLALAASTTYSVEGFLYVRADNNSSDVIIGFDIPNGSTMKVTYVAYDGANNIKGGGFLSADATASSAIDLSTSTATDIAIWFRGLIITGTTADNVRLQWAQASPGNNRETTVEVNSFMEAKRVE